MKSFFANMNFVRGVMLVCLVAAGALGYLASQAQARVDDLRTKTTKTAPFLGREIQELSVELNELQKIESGSEFEAMENPQQYVRTIGFKDSVAVGDMSVDTTRRPKSHVPGTEDRVYGVEPPDRKRPFPRAKIANFMYLLEAESPFVVVTKLEMKQIDKVKPEEFATDRWTFQLDLTSRVPEEE